MSVVFILKILIKSTIGLDQYTDTDEGHSYSVNSGLARTQTQAVRQQTILIHTTPPVSKKRSFPLFTVRVVCLCGKLIMTEPQSEDTTDVHISR